MIKVDMLQGRCTHCDALYVLGVGILPPGCPEDAEQVVTTICVELSDSLASEAIEAGVAFVHDSEPELGN